MKTIIEFKDGRTETVEHATPTFVVDEGYFFCNTEANEVITEDFRIEETTRVTVKFND
jgi:hypothetical protein